MRLDRRLGRGAVAGVASLACVLGGCGSDTMSTPGPPTGQDGGVQEPSDGAGTVDAAPDAVSALPADTGMVGGLDAQANGGDARSSDIGSGDAVAGALSDQEITGVLNAVDLGEIQEGTLARSRAVAPAVQGLAALMVGDHARSNTQLKALTAELGITSSDGDVSQMLRADEAATLGFLGQQQGRSFDVGYLAAQVAAHRRVLDILDSALIPGVHAPLLRDVLQGTVRPMVLEHLRKVLQVQGSLGVQS